MMLSDSVLVAITQSPLLCAYIHISHHCRDITILDLRPNQIYSECPIVYHIHKDPVSKEGSLTGSRSIMNLGSTVLKRPLEHLFLTDELAG